MKTRNIGAGVVREYGIVSVESVANDGSGPWVVEVTGTYGRQPLCAAP
jgi:hypothetical protein